MCDLLHEVDEPLDALLFDVLRHLVGHGRRLSPASRREDERERAVVADFLDDLERLLEVPIGLAREADDDVRRQGEVGDPSPHLVREPEVALPAVRPLHRLQDARRARLERQVCVLADRIALGHGGDQLAPKVLGVRAREADALDSRNGIAGPQQLGEVRFDVGRQVSAPRVDVLPQESELANALLGELGHLRQDLSGPSADLLPAHLRDDAVRAHRVAAHRDLHPRLEAPLAVRGEAGGERPLLADAEARARCLSPRAQPLAEVRDRARSEGDVDEGVEVEQALALRLRVAAADGDHLLAVALLEGACLGDARSEAQIGLLADGARVEDDDVGLVLRRRLAQSELLEHALDALGVVGVHLAAERGDVVPLHGRNCTAAIWRTRPRATRG